MVFQWYLFVLLVMVAWLSNSSGQTYTINIDGRREKRYKWGPILILLVPMVYLAATRTDTFGDTYGYIIGFRNTPTSILEIPRIIDSETKDPGFVVFRVLIKSIIGNHYQIYFAIIATICLFCVAYVFKKYSCNFVMSMFLFIASSDYVQWTHNGIRQFIAVAVVFAATDLLIQKKYWRYFAVVLIMSSIHASALIMIPVSLIVQGKAWNIKTVFLTALSLIAINFSDITTGVITDFMAETQYGAEVGQFLETEGTNIFRVLVFCIPPVTALIFQKRLIHANSKILNLSTNMSIVSMGAYLVSSATSGIFIGRIPIYFSLYNYILLPWLVENVFDKRSQKLVYGAIVLCYLLFYYYQISVTWGL